MESIKLVKSEMKKQGISQGKLSREVGVKQPYINNFLKFSTITNLVLLKKICRVLSIQDQRMKDCLLRDKHAEISVKWEEIII